MLDIYLKNDMVPNRKECILITDERAEEIEKAVDKWEMKDERDVMELKGHFFHDFVRHSEDRQKMADEIGIPLNELIEWFDRVIAGNGKFI